MNAKALREAMDHYVRNGDYSSSKAAVLDLLAVVNTEIGLYRYNPEVQAIRTAISGIITQFS
jgi:hypothetical protein